MKQVIKPITLNTNTINSIIKFIADTAITTYGVASLALKSEVNPLHLTLKKGNKEPAIFINKITLTDFSVELYVNLSYGVKISETLSECQKILKYQLDKAYPTQCKSVNVYAETLVL